MIPAVTHVDGSGRLQTVAREANPRYWQLIRAFGERTGVPVLLNTSFNENEPIVHRPAEALDCFLRTRMDVLVLGDQVIAKDTALLGLRLDAHRFLQSLVPPGHTATGQLLTDLCEDLVRDHGCRVSVVTGPPLNPPAGYERPRGFVSRDTYRGVEIHRASGTRFDKRRFAGRATNYVTYFLSACWAGLRLDRPTSSSR